MKNYTRLLIILLISSCATISIPEGGEKDMSPPKLLSSTPDSAQTMFRGESIELVFDEFFSVKNFNTQVLVSPPFDKPLKYKIRGKKLRIDFPSYPLINTTYQINFGEAISDINEGNILKNLQLVFSTGEQIDSSELRGKIEFPPILPKIESNLKVFLYPDYNDTNFIKNKPYYITTADKSGNYSFKHLKTGLYQILALEDKNANYQYDKGEHVATLYHSVKTDQNIDDLILFSEEVDESASIQKIRALNNSEYSVTGSSFDKLLSIQLVYPSKDSGQNIPFLKNFKDTTRLFLLDSFAYTDSIIFRFKFSDTSLNHKYFPKKSKKRFKPYLRLSSDFPAPISPIKLKANFPIELVSPKSISLFDMTDSIPFLFESSISVKNELELNGNFQEEQKLLLLLDSGSFGFPANHLRDSINFRTQNKRSTTNLSFQIENPNSKRLIIQLLTNTNVYEEWLVSRDTTISAPYLNPGKYQLIAIHDKDENKRYTSGNISLKREPESTFKLETSIELKADWELKDLKYKID